SVDVRMFLAALSAYLFSALQLDPTRLRLVVDAGDLKVDIQRAVPVALILNELITNALKHAFPGSRPGMIHVGVQGDGKENSVSVADDGVGMPPELMTPNPTSSLGLQLINVLVEQLGGKLEIQSPPGTRFTIRFPSPAAMKPPSEIPKR